MFNEVKTNATNNKIGTAITTAAVAGGIVYGIVRKKGFWGVFGYAIGFGLAGLAISTAIAQGIKK